MMTEFYIWVDYFFLSLSARNDAVAFGSAFYLVLMGYPQPHNLAEVNNPCHSLKLHSCASNGGL